MGPTEKCRPLQKFLWHTRAVDPQKLKTNGLNEALPRRLEIRQLSGITQSMVFEIKYIEFFGSCSAPSHPPFHHPHHSEVRKLLSDFSVIGVDLFSKEVLILLRRLPN